MFVQKLPFCVEIQQN